MKFENFVCNFLIIKEYVYIAVDNTCMQIKQKWWKIIVDGGGKEDEYLTYWSEIEGVRWKFVLSRNVDHAKYMYK